jgi:hypothetical protein
MGEGMGFFCFWLVGLSLGYPCDVFFFFFGFGLEGRGEVVDYDDVPRL